MPLAGSFFPFSDTNKTMKSKPFSLFAALLATTALISTASAANLTWDSTGLNPTAPLNGAGAWDTTSAFWSNGTTDSIWNNAASDTAVFGGGTSTGTAGTVTLATGITAGGLTFNLGGYTITADTLTLGGTPVIDTGANAATINSALAGSAGFTKNGGGALTLGGANTALTGQIVVSTGTLKAANATALGAGGAANETVVQTGATLDINAQALTVTEIVNIAGTGVGGLGALINSGGQQQNALNHVTLTADATVGGTGRFDLRSGTAPTLDLAGFTLTKIGANQFSIVGANVTSGNIAINVGTLGIEAGSTVTGTGTISIASAGTLGLYGVANITRNITSNGGTINNLGLAATVASNIALTGTTTLVGTATTYNGAISGGNLTVGTGTATAVTIGSTGSVTTGTLLLGAGNAGNTFTVAASGVVNAASVNNAWGTDVTVNGAINVTGTYNISTNAARILAGTGTITAASFTTGNSATVVNYSLNAMNLTNSMTLGGSGSISFNQSAGTINTAGLALNNSGTNTYALTGGRINIGASGVTGSGATKNINLGGGTLGARGADWSSSLPMKITTAATGVTFNTLDSVGGINGQTITLSGVLSGAVVGPPASTDGKLNKVGLGTLLLNAANTYTGLTTVSGGVLGGIGSLAGPLTVEAAGTIAPGASVGTFSVGGNTALAGTYACEINGATSDLLAVTGDLALGGALTVSSTAPTGTEWVIATYSGALTGTFASLPSGYTVDTTTPGQVKLLSSGATNDYSDWAATNAPGQGANGDYDNDGVSNGAEYVLGGLATTSDSDKLPKVTASGSNLVFTFKRDQDSKTADTSVFVEVGTTLASWPFIYTVGISPEITVIDGGDGFDTVTLTVAKDSDTKKFARLKVTID